MLALSAAHSPTLRPSRACWGGTVPPHWEVRRVGHLAQVGNGSTPRREEGRFWAEPGCGVPWLNSARINDGHILAADQWVTDLALRECHLPRVNSGSVLVAITGEGQTRGRAALLGLDATISQHLVFLRPLSRIRARFLWRQFQALYAWLRDQSSGVGSTRAALTCDFLRSIPLAVPPLDEQDAIADFLDRKTAAIDVLIQKKERLALALEDERQAVIAKAVTQGLRPSASLVNSGLPWIGQVPSQWKVAELRRIVRPGTSITYGIVQAGPHVEDGIPYIRTSDMAGERLPLDGYGKTSREIDSAYHRSKVAAGDIVVAIRATVGKALVVPPELAGANLTQGTAKISPGPHVLSNYLWYALRSAPSVQRFEALAKGVTFREITLDMLRRFRIPLPPLAEQEEICRHLADEDVRLLSSRCMVEQSCERLREYRQALITAAVTGQLNVSRDAA